MIVFGPLKSLWPPIHADLVGASVGVVKNILLTPHSSFIVSSLSIAPVKGELRAILELHNWYYLEVGDP